MFDSLKESLSKVFQNFFQHKTVTEENIAEAIRQVRLALLDADVQYGVAKTLIQKIKEKSLGTKLLQNVSAHQLFIKIVHDELIDIMGSSESVLCCHSHPSTFLVCGLQGCGKTTFCVKLAAYLKRKTDKKHPLLVACDLQRPAAILQLQQLGAKAGIPVFVQEGVSPIEVAKSGLSYAKQQGCNAVIFDTAGRLHIDDELMQELQALKALIRPDEVLFVANAALGQDAVKTASAFETRLGITGSVLTMLDGDARGGAAISIYQVTNKPLKFEGIGEGINDIQVFNPHSMADRILMMGDTINLVKKAQEFISDKEAKELESKVRKGTFTYSDYLDKLRTLKKMGSMQSLLKMLPIGGMLDLGKAEEDSKAIEAMICAMTPKEREVVDELSVPRMKRIARGSAVSFDRVAQLKKSFQNMRTLCKGSNMKRLEQILGSMKKYGG